MTGWEWAVIVGALVDAAWDWVEAHGRVAARWRLFRRWWKRSVVTTRRLHDAGPVLLLLMMAPAGDRASSAASAAEAAATGWGAWLVGAVLGIVGSAVWVWIEHGRTGR